MVRIVVVNIKGGCGKTTIATHLAAAMAQAGAKTALADVDRQKSALDWLARRPGDLPAIKGLDWRSDIGDVPKKTRRLVIDAPAALRSKNVEQLIKEADVVVAPMQPSMFDEAAAARFLARLEKIKPVRKGSKDVLMVGNRVRPRTRAAKRLADFLEELGRPAAAMIGERARYADAADDGVTIFDTHLAKDAALRAEWAPLLEALEP